MSPQNCLQLRLSSYGSNDNAVPLGGMILDIPAGPRRQGYAKARVEVRQLLDGRWRVYHKDELLLETTSPVMQAPLKHKKHKTGKKRQVPKALTKIERIRSRLTHDLGVTHT
jgi:hypothetical protein